MKSNREAKNRVKSVDTMFDIVEYLEAHGSARIAEIAADLDVAPSTAHRHLSTLVDREYLDKEGDRYRLGLRFLGLGETARCYNEAYHLTREKVNELVEETNERGQFLIEEHGKGVYVYIARSERAVRTDPGIGHRVPLHVAAAGKAILAHLPPARAQTIIDNTEFEVFTDYTITDRARLEQQLEVIRETGYGVNDQEFIDGLRAVGAPITGPNDTILGAISISGPRHRMKGQWFEAELPDLLLGTVTEIELNLAYS